MGFKMFALSRRSLALSAILLCACAGLAPQRPQGEAVIAAANPHAVEAGVDMLRRGGSATDAAIAAELVLGLVEPQSSGLGGGGFLVHYDARSHALDAYDGREIAPAGATPDMFLDGAGRPLPRLQAMTSGRAIGAPALIPMLKLAHDAHGRLPWAQLFEPAIRLADEGFAISPRMHRWVSIVAARGGFAHNAAARAYLLSASGEALPVGTLLRNPAYAQTLRAIARHGPRAMTQGPIADAIVAGARAQPLPGSLTLEDLRRVRPRRLAAVCGVFRVYRVCSMPPPSSGGIAVIELLGLYARARPNPAGNDDPDDWAAFLWAGRLAYADRDHYVADDEFVPVPTRELLAPAYLDARAREIDIARAPADVAPGDPSRALGGPAIIDRWGRDATDEAPGTTHLSVIDRDGNVVALTATVEAPFGSQRMAAGFFLNNQLTDFSFTPEINGRPVANAVQPGKRPRSSMAPVIMFSPDGAFYAAIGSPGGSAIIAYVARTIIGFTDWDLSLQEAIDLGHFVAAGPVVRRETSRAQPSLAQAIAARGWRLRDADVEDSGLHGLRVTARGVEAGVDPRREGAVGRVPAVTPPAR